MQYRFVSRKEGSKRLIVIYAGWATDANLFDGLYRPGYDIVVVWDYRDMYIDWSLADGYIEICIIAWSLGVYASAVSTHGIADRITKRIAVNGTLTPVDSRCGIPEAIFKGTLYGLNLRNLEKFYRRVCGTRSNIAFFENHRPDRNLEELKEELSCFCPLPLLAPEPEKRWDVAIVGRDDAIFPAVNQARAWNGVAPVFFADIPHLPDFQTILDRWIMDKELTERRFASGKETYDSEADVQDEVVESMRHIMEEYDIPAIMCRRGSRTLEIGSGTGKMSRLLDHYAGRFGTVEMWDIVGEEPLQGEHRFFRCCDAELAIMQQPPASLDFIVSASTVQWFNSPSRFLKECSRVLNKGAYLLIGTYSEGNLAEVASHTGCSLPLMTPGQWKEMMPPELECLAVSCTDKRLSFDSVLDVFRHLKKTGVNSLGRPEDVSLRRAIKDWHPDLDGKYSITYKPMVFIARKK